MTTNENITVVLKAGTKVTVEKSGMDFSYDATLSEDVVAEVFAMGEEWNIYTVGADLYYVKASEDC